MNPFSPAVLAAVVLSIRLLGRPVALRGLTLSQKTIAGIPGRKNQDVKEIQDQSAQVAEQTVQLAESVYTADWTDPDLHGVDPAVSGLVESIKANAALHD